MDNQAEMTLNGIGLGIGVTPSTNLHVNGNAIVSDQLFVGGSSGSSNLNVNGTLGYGFQTISSNTTLNEYSIALIDSSSDNITITLPYAGNVTGRQYEIKKISAENTVWVSGGGNLIDDTSPIELPESNNLASVKLISNGSQWYKINQKYVSETVASNNLVAWWKFDEVSGSIALDSSNNNFIGTLNNFNFDTKSISGKLSRALNFDSTSSYINISPVVNTAGWPEASISAWVNYDGSGVNEHTIISSWTSTINQSQILLRVEPADHSIEAYFKTEDSTTTSALFTDLSLTINQWHHVIVTFDQINGIQGFVDGVKSTISTATPNTLDTSSTASMRIGESPHNTNDDFIGFLDDLRIYNRSLTPSEIQALYNQGQ